MTAASENLFVSSRGLKEKLYFGATSREEALEGRKVDSMERNKAHSRKLLRRQYSYCQLTSNITDMKISCYPTEAPNCGPGYQVLIDTGQIET